MDAKPPQSRPRLDAASASRTAHCSDPSNLKMDASENLDRDRSRAMHQVNDFGGLCESTAQVAHSIVDRDVNSTCTSSPLCRECPQAVYTHTNASGGGPNCVAPLPRMAQWQLKREASSSRGQELVKHEEQGRDAFGPIGSQQMVQELGEQTLPATQQSSDQQGVQQPDRDLAKDETREGVGSPQSIVQQLGAQQRALWTQKPAVQQQRVAPQLVTPQQQLQQPQQPSRQIERVQQQQPLTAVLQPVAVQCTNGWIQPQQQLTTQQAAGQVLVELATGQQVVSHQQQPAQVWAVVVKRATTAVQQQAVQQQAAQQQAAQQQAAQQQQPLVAVQQLVAVQRTNGEIQPQQHLTKQQAAGHVLVQLATGQQQVQQQLVQQQHLEKQTAPQQQTMIQQQAMVQHQAAMQQQAVVHQQQPTQQEAVAVAQQQLAAMQQAMMQQQQAVQVAVMQQAAAMQAAMQQQQDAALQQVVAMQQVQLQQVPIQQVPLRQAPLQQQQVVMQQTMMQQQEAVAMQQLPLQQVPIQQVPLQQAPLLQQQVVMQQAMMQQQEAVAMQQVAAMQMAAVKEEQVLMQQVAMQLQHVAALQPFAVVLQAAMQQTQVAAQQQQQQQQQQQVTMMQQASQHQMVAQVEQAGMQGPAMAQGTGQQKNLLNLQLSEVQSGEQAGGEQLLSRQRQSASMALDLRLGAHQYMSGSQTASCGPQMISTAPPLGTFTGATQQFFSAALQSGELTAQGVQVGNGGQPVQISAAVDDAPPTSTETSPVRKPPTVAHASTTPTPATSANQPLAAPTPKAATTPMDAQLTSPICNLNASAASKSSQATRLQCSLVASTRTCAPPPLLVAYLLAAASTT